ncbi:4'-phosphopantetheinyl transferase family protein [Comamonas sediminis]|uniref:4'-phosphopantetheinyl transferase superfamily protein n=1 Tax=Comamonas sediminis TaxID=1783360 RepID=A0ABV4B640_9BURK
MAGLALTGTPQPLALPPALQGRVRAQAVRMAAAASGVLPREAMREAVYRAIGEALAPQLGCAPAQLAVQRRAGQAPQLLRNGQVLPAWQLSISYADAMAVWACTQEGAVGIDVQGPLGDENTGIDAAGWPAVAALYLEPDAAAALTGLQRMDWQRGFAQQWARLEAQLKCAGMPLTEVHHRPPGWNAGILVADLPSDSGALALAWRASV